MSKCYLTLPHTEEFRRAVDLETILRMINSNMLNIQRWADEIQVNGCCCSGAATATRQKCALKIPHLVNPTLPQMLDNFLALERWSTAWANGDCCTCTTDSNRCLLHVPHKILDKDTAFLNEKLVADFQRILWWSKDFVDFCCACEGCVWGITNIGTLTRTFPHAITATATDAWATYAGGGGSTGIARLTYPGLVENATFPFFALRAGSIGCFGITTDQAGNVYYCDATASDSVIFKIDSSLTRTTVGTYTGFEWNSLCYYGGKIYAGDGSVGVGIHEIDPTTGTRTPLDVTMGTSFVTLVATPSGIVAGDDTGTNTIYAYNALPAATRTTVDTGQLAGMSPLVGNNKLYYPKGFTPGLTTEYSANITSPHSPVVDSTTSAIFAQGDSDYLGSIFGKTDVCLVSDGSTVWEGACGNT